MTSEWNQMPLGEIALFIDYRGKTPPKQGFGIPLVTAKIIKNNIIQQPEEFIAEDYYDEWMRRGIPQKGDVIFTTEAPLGEVAQIKTSEKLAFAQRIIILHGYPHITDTAYLFYNLQYNVTKKRIEARSTGTTVFGIKSAELKKVLIDLPGLPTQKLIASTLNCIDEKIEINNKINTNLEAQAQAIFKSWFDSLDSDTWDFGNLADIAYLNPQRQLKQNDLATYVEMSNLPTKGSFPIDWTKRPYSGGMKFRNGDTLLARITPCLENGKAAYVNFLDKDEVAFGSTEYIVLSAKEGFPNEMLYFLVRDKQFINYAIKCMSGSTGRQRVSSEMIGKYKMPIPPKAFVSNYSSVLRDIMNSILFNSYQNRTLSSLRDTLLPKLMSGEIEVPIV